MITIKQGKVCKKITKHESEFIKMALDKHIIPKVYSLTNSMVKMVEYQTTLGAYIEDNDITELSGLGDIPEQIQSLIDKLHGLDIFHGDLHADNIVLNPDKNEVRIIDFGKSKKISELNEKDVVYFNEFLNLDPPVETVEQLVQSENTSRILSWYLL